MDSNNYEDITVSLDYKYDPISPLSTTSHDDSSIHDLISFPLQYDDNGEFIIEEDVTSFQELTSSKQRPGPSMTLIAKIPERNVIHNFSCDVPNGRIHIHDNSLQVMQSVHLNAKHGIVIGKQLRSHTIHLSTNELVQIQSSLEGQDVNVKIIDGRFRCKKINASNINIYVDHQKSNETTNKEPLDSDDELAFIDVSSLYTTHTGNGAHFQVSTKHPHKLSTSLVRVKSNHGHLSVDASTDCICENDNLEMKKPLVDLEGVNGSLDVSIHAKENKNNDGFTATQVHINRLAHDSLSIVTSNVGNIQVSCDRKLESDVRLLSSNQISKYDPNLLLSTNENEILSILQQQSQTQQNDVDQDEKLQIETLSFDEKINEKTNEYEYKSGSLTNKSQEPDSRKELGGGGGKIHLQGAAQQALSGFSDETTALPSLLAIGTSGNIKLETTSWMGNIAKRYGVSLEDTHKLDLGRQALAGNPKLRNATAPKKNQ